MLQIYRDLQDIHDFPPESKTQSESDRPPILNRELQVYYVLKTSLGRFDGMIAANDPSVPVRFKLEYNARDVAYLHGLAG